MKTLPSARLLTIIPSTRGMTMLNFPVAPWIFIRNNPVFKGWIKMTGTSFSRVVDLRKRRKNSLPHIDVCELKPAMCKVRISRDLLLGSGLRRATSSNSLSRSQGCCPHHLALNIHHWGWAFKPRKRAKKCA